MPTLHIYLLGDFQIIFNNVAIATAFDLRLQKLLVYLVVHRTAPIPRQYLAFQLWPDSNEAQARTNLRNLLHLLRKALPEAAHLLAIEKGSVQWRPNGPFTLDIDRFELAVAQAHQFQKQGDSAAARHSFEEAIKIYRGDLLPSCYDDWIEGERKRLRRRFAETLEQFIQLLVEASDFRAAISYVERLLQLADLEETTYQRLMHLYTLSGDRSGMLYIYRAYVNAMRELGVEPDRVAREAYERLIDEKAADVMQQSAAQITPTVKWPLVGRQREWRRLHTTLSSATNGQPHFVCIAGEAGIGKTRLAEELIEWANQQGMVTARTRSYAAAGRLAFEPVAEWLRTDAFQARLARLDAIWLAELARLLPKLLLEHPNLPRPEPMTEGWQRTRFFEALARGVLSESSAILLVIDDLQWCDPDTLEWLYYFLRFNLKARLLIVGTVRSEEIDNQHPLTTLLLNLRRDEQLTELELGPLTPDETVTLAGQVTGADLDVNIALRLHQETDGNPLFIVETMRAKLSEKISGQDSRIDSSLYAVPQLSSFSSSLPPKIQAVIQSRLVRLSPAAHELVSLAAVIGRSFTFDVLVHASDSDEQTLARSLDELWLRHIVREQDVNTYDFTHDHIREVTYLGITPALRRHLHRRVAQALETVYVDNLANISAQNATHYERAGMPEQAVIYYQRSATVAQQIGANADAIHFLNKGLTLLAILPETPDRTERTLELQVSLGTVLTTFRGHASPEAEQAFLHALDLCHKVGNKADHLLPILAGLWVCYLVRGKLERALEIVQQIQQSVISSGNLAFKMMADFGLGETTMFLGDLKTSKVYADRIIMSYDPDQHSTVVEVFSFGYDPGLAHLFNAVVLYWLLGELEKSQRIANEALARTRQLNHPYNLAYGLSMAAVVQQFCGNVEICQKLAEEAIAHSEKYGIRQWLAHSQILFGWVQAQQGYIGTGLEQISRAIVAWQATGAQVAHTYYLLLLAEAHGQAGQVEAGLAVIAEAEAIAAKNGEHWMDAEHARLKGELMHLRGDPETEVAACFQQAIEIARTQGTKSLELRSVLSLARLYRAEQSVAVREMLAEILAQFASVTAPYISKDLSEARMLLQELA